MTMKINVLLAVLLLAVGAFAGESDTPEGLAEQFISAINTKSAEKQRTLVHPQCLAGLAGLQKEFMDETLSRDFRRVIPEKRNVKVTALKGPDLPFAGAMAWPVTPTHQIEVEFSTGENASVSVIRFTAKEKDRWFIIIPMLNPENLKKYEEKKASQQTNAPASSSASDSRR
ncbi:MAG: hypothetical protein WCP86_01490 [bacterium]